MTLLLALVVPLAVHAQTVIPYLENFESYTNVGIGVGVTPTNWTVIPGNNTVCEVIGTSSGKYLRIGRNSAISSATRIVTAELPSFSSNLRVLKLTFKLRAIHTSGSLLQVGYNDRQGNFQSVQNFLPKDYQTQTTVTVDFNGPTGVRNNIIIKYTGDTADALWFIDDVQVTFSTKDPNSLSASNVTGSSAYLSWSLVGNAEQYQVQYADNDSFSNAQTVSTSTKSVTLTSLSSETSYYARVRSVYGSSALNNLTYSNWSNVASFTTSATTCLPPTGLTVSDITSTGATFAWDAEQGEVFQYFMRPLPYTYDAQDFIRDNNESYYNGPYTYDVSFNPGTDNVFYLRKVCEGNDYSDPVSVEFHTPCEAITALGYSEYFDGYTVPEAWNPSTRILPSCWNAINTTTYSSNMAFPTIFNYGNNAYSGYNCLFIYSAYSDMTNQDPRPQYAIMPRMDDLGGIEVTLWAKGHSEASTFKIGTMTDPTDASTFTEITEQALTTSYQRYIYAIPANTTNQYIAFMIDAADSDRITNGVYIDDIVIPTCSRPTGLHVAELTARSVRLEWDAEEGDLFQPLMPGGQPTYPFDPNNPPTNWNIQPTSNNYAIWNTLSPETTYGVWLRKYCSETDQSEPIYIRFTTPEACPAPTGLHVAELTAHSVRIEWDAEEGAMFQEDFNTGSFDPNTPPDNWNTEPDYDNYATWDGLEPNHFYGIWVRKYCSETDQSEPIYITFTTPDACPAPTGLAVSDVTSTGANFTWNAESGAAFEYFTVSDPWDGYEPAVDQSWTATPNNTVGWENAFSPNEVVRFYLRKDCGNDGYSDYTYVEFRTLCDPMSLGNGYREDFNNFTNVSTNEYDTPTGYPDVDLPHCWQFLNRSESAEGYPQAFLSSNSEYAVSGNCLFFKSSSTTPLYAILPEFVQNIAEYQLTFTYCNENVNENNGTLYVGYMTDPSDASTFKQTLACPQTTTKTEKTAYFPHAPQGSFMAFKYVGGLYDNYYLGIDDVVVMTGPSCFPTGTLDCVSLSSRTAALSWQLIDSQQHAWRVEYSESNQFFEPVYHVDVTQNWNVVIEDLEPETQYYARVRGNCGDGSLSDVSNTITFTTLDACPVPTNVTASNLTQNTADISWTGSEDVGSYHVKWHRTAQVVGINEQFDEEYLAPDGWQVKTGLLSDVMNGAALSGESSPYWHFGTSNGVFDSHAYLEVWNTSCKSWLITPRHRVKQSDSFTFDLALTACSGTVGSPATTGTDDRFVVLIGYNNGQNWEILREWNNSGSEYVYNDIAHTATGEQVSIDLSDYVGIDVRIAFYGESTVSNANNNLHIDNVKIGTQYGAGGYYNYQFSQPFATLTDNLEPGMEYEVQVKSDCSDPEVWSEPITFKTLDAYTKVFVGGQAFGNFTAEQVGDKWWNPYNWVPYGMPSALNGSPKDDVILRHDAVIANDFTTGRNIIADANSITFEGTPKPTLTIEDGNQLRLNTNISEQNQVTVKKNIIGYAGTNDLYYLISIPAYKSGSLNAVISGLVTTDSEYDLYDFNPTEELEWRNYKAESFSLYQGEGYLYANAADVQLRFTGEIRNNRENYTIWNMSYDGQNEYAFNGWDLCGNPFTCNAYLSSESQTMAYYRMNAEGTGFEAVTNFIKPMEGFFLQNTVNDESVVLSRTAPSKGVRCLNLVLSQVAARRDGVSTPSTGSGTASTTLDNAIIRFDEGNTLEKLSFRESSSKIYMPVEGKDFAVVNAGQMGELPVSFKAENNGSYTLSFTNEDVEFSYLHLIDNLTGADVDLLSAGDCGSESAMTTEGVSYTFTAKKSDYASRFRLVFATGSSASSETGSFGFVNASGNLCIFGIEGEATVQVIDVLGHVLSSEQFSGSYEKRINGAPGVYMVRLIQGNDVKIQKVIVK